MKFTENTFKESINRLANTEDGRIVLAGIRHICNWDMTVLTSDDATQTLYYAAKRGVYGGIRKNIDPEHLKKIEFDYELTIGQKEKNNGK